MGYTGLEVKKGNTTKNLLASDFSGLDVVDFNTKGGVIYVAHRNKNGEVVPLVIKTERYKSNGKPMVAYKDMPDYMLPYYYDMSEKVFKKLTPINELTSYSERDKETAGEWRKTVVEVQQSPQNKLKTDSIFKVDKPISFGKGLEQAEYFRKDKNGFTALDYYPETGENHDRFKCSLPKDYLSRLTITILN